MKSFGHKDRQTIVTFVVTGILLLALLNGLFVLLAIQSQWTIWVAIGTAILGYIFWKLYRLLTKLTYTFSHQHITITLPNQKEIILAFAHIKSITPYARVPRWRGWGIIAVPQYVRFLYTTASSRLLCIEMNDGTQIYITPKTYPNDLQKLKK